MLSNILTQLKKMFSGPTEQENLDAFIAKQHPTSVCDVEYWMNVYDRRQHAQRSQNIVYWNN